MILTDGEVGRDLGLWSEQSVALEEFERERKQRYEAFPKRPGASAPKEERQAASEKIRMLSDAIEQELRPRIWAVLMPEQRDRLRQLVRRLDVFRALTEDPDVVRAVGLSADQKAALAEIRGKSVKEMREVYEYAVPFAVAAEREEELSAARDEQALAVLTDDQRARWSELAGPPFNIAALWPRIRLDGVLRRPAEPANPAEAFAARFGPVRALTLLADGMVVEEIGLTAEQVAALDDLKIEQNRQSGKLADARRQAAATGQQKRDSIEKILADERVIENAVRQRIWEVLTEGQRQRLQQIFRQVNVAGSLAADAEVSRAIRLSFRQHVALSEVSRRYHETLDEIRRSGPSAGPILEREDAAADARNAEALAILTDDQRASWRDVAGPPFDVTALRPTLRAR
jgi:hypothetical protein